MNVLQNGGSSAQGRCQSGIGSVWVWYGVVGWGVGVLSIIGMWYDLIDLYFKLCDTNILHKEQIIHRI